MIDGPCPVKATKREFPEATRQQGC